MRLHISKGNMKLGKIPNISLPPVTTCRPRVPCAKQCYAQKAMRLYPQTRKAWTENLDFLELSGEAEFFTQVSEWLAQNKPTHFRWHVSGDTPSTLYAVLVYQIAKIFPDVKFMMFTKRWDLLPDQPPPENLAVILSMWPGLRNPKGFEDFPRAWLSSDKRKPNFYFKCPGRCDECYKCWDIVDLGYDVVFDLH